jgi:hypothetical protein
MFVFHVFLNTKGANGLLVMRLPAGRQGYFGTGTQIVIAIAGVIPVDIHPVIARIPVHIQNAAVFLPDPIHVTGNTNWYCLSFLALCEQFSEHARSIKSGKQFPVWLVGESTT